MKRVSPWADAVRQTQGVITIEALLTLPVLLLLVFFFVGCIHTLQAVLILEHALTSVCREVADASYLIEQTVGLGLSFLPEPSGAQADIVPEMMAEVAADAAADVGRQVIGSLQIYGRFSQYLEEYPALREAVEWQTMALPDGREEWGNEDVRL